MQTDKERCYCGTVYLNPDTAQHAYGGVPCCNRACFNKARLDDGMALQDYEPMSVMGSAA